VEAIREAAVTLLAEGYPPDDVWNALHEVLTAHGTSGWTCRRLCELVRETMDIARCP